MTPYEEVFSRRGGVKMVLMELEQLREAVAQLNAALPSVRTYPPAPRALAILKRRQVRGNCSAAAAGGWDDGFAATANGNCVDGNDDVCEDGSLPTGLPSDQLVQLELVAASDGKAPSECRPGGKEQQREWPGSRIPVSESQAAVPQHAVPSCEPSSQPAAAALPPAMAGRSWAPVQDSGNRATPPDGLQARAVVGRSASLPRFRPADLPDAGWLGPQTQLIPGGWSSGPAASGSWYSELPRKQRVSRLAQSDQDSDVVLVRAVRPPGPSPKRSSSGGHLIGGGGGRGGGGGGGGRGGSGSMVPETAAWSTGKIRPASPASPAWPSRHARYERQLDRLLAEVVGQAQDPLGRGTPGSWPGTYT